MKYPKIPWEEIHHKFEIWADGHRQQDDEFDCASCWRRHQWPQLVSIIESYYNYNCDKIFKESVKITRAALGHHGKAGK